MTGRGDEGVVLESERIRLRFAPDLSSNEEAIEVILQAIEKTGLRPGEDVYIALDPATSELYDKESGLYILDIEGKKLSSEEMVDLWADWVARFPIISIEDGLDEDDWEGFKLMVERVGDTVQIVGDDYVVTQAPHIRSAAAAGAFVAHPVAPTRTLARLE